MRTIGPMCSQCNDAADAVTPFNGSALLAKTVAGEVVVALHKRCEGLWADKNNCETLVPLKRMRQSGSVCASKLPKRHSSASSPS
jgi:hypothetical protein